MIFFYQFNLKVLAFDLTDRGTCYSLVFYNTEIPGLLLFTWTLDNIKKELSRFLFDKTWYLTYQPVYEWVS